jgi:hypothetical protein
MGGGRERAGEGQLNKKKNGKGLADDLQRSPVLAREESVRIGPKKRQLFFPHLTCCAEFKGFLREWRKISGRVFNFPSVRADTFLPHIFPVRMRANLPSFNLEAVDRESSETQSVSFCMISWSLHSRTYQVSRTRKPLQRADAHPTFSPR